MQIHLMEIHTKYSDTIFSAFSNGYHEEKNWTFVYLSDIIPLRIYMKYQISRASKKHGPTKIQEVSRMRQIEAEICNKKNILVFPHLHNEIEFLICTEGEIEVTCGQEKQIIQKNGFALVMPFTMHMYQTLKYSKSLIITISRENLPIFHQYLTKEPLYPFVETLRCDDVEYVTNQLCAENLSNLTIEQLIGYVHIILNAAFQKMTFREKKGMVDLLPDVLEYINDNFQNHLSLNDIARHVGVNPSYLSRFFSDKFGSTITKYINEIRINYAKVLLLSSEDSITEIAYKCGFESIRSFNRTFLDFVNVTPREYRNDQNRAVAYDFFSPHTFKKLLTTSGLSSNNALTFYK